ncbi:DUF3515 domain-containing protein [Nesterenkonia rhizosphaerae]|uniref:DUF3515 domain-containing protein n=2 Tax=Micrococcaceae TaxID=1268 RepID=A0ABP9G4I9_9MICC
MLAAGMLLLTSCAATATVEPAPNAEDPDCAEVMLRLPEVIGDQERRPTSSQGTAVWGEPSEIVLRCGVEPIGPTTEPCVRYGGIDWVAMDREDHWQLISYGRVPTVEVLLAMEQISSVNAMPPLTDAVSRIEQSRECTAYVENSEDL